MPNGAQVLVEDGQTVEPGKPICRWEPHITPIVSDRSGKVRFDEIVEGETLRTERDTATGAERRVIMEHKGELHPQIVIEDDHGQPLTTFYMPEKAFLEVKRRPEGVGRLAAGQDAARGVRHAGHHRRSAARDGNLRGADAARPGQDGRGGGRGAAGREEARQAHRSTFSRWTTPATRSARSASIRCRRASTCASTPATASRKATGWCSARWCRTRS